MVFVYRYRPKGASHPPRAPLWNKLSFRHTPDQYIPGLDEFDLVVKAQSALPKLVSHVYEGRLVGLDVKPRVGMQVVHTRLARGTGIIVKVLKIPNDATKAPRGGVCRVSWDNERFNTREGCYTGRDGNFSLAAVKLDVSGVAETQPLQEKAFEMGEVLVGKHLKPRIGMRVMGSKQSYIPPTQTGTIMHVRDNLDSVLVKWDVIGASSKELNTGQRGQYQLALVLSSSVEDSCTSGSSEESDDEEEGSKLPPMRLVHEKTTLVGMDVEPTIGLRVMRRRKEWYQENEAPIPSQSPGDNDTMSEVGTIVQLGANGKLACVRWDKSHMDVKFYAVGFNDFYELMLDSTPKQRSLIVGRNCLPQVGLRVEMLDPRRETDFAAKIHSPVKSVFKTSVGVVKKIINSSDRMFPDVFVVWLPGLESGTYLCGRHDLFFLKTCSDPERDPFHKYLTPDALFDLKLAHLRDPQKTQGNMSTNDVDFFIRMFLEDLNTPVLSLSDKQEEEDQAQHPASPTSPSLPPLHARRHSHLPSSQKPSGVVTCVALARQQLRQAKAQQKQSKFAAWTKR